MGAVDEILETDTSRIRKWGTQLLALADYTAPVPEQFFTSGGEPILPPEFQQLGFITTDGITRGTSVSSESTSMVQQLEPVRTDVTGIEETLTCTFGEGSSAWTQALIHAKPVAEWPADPHSPWVYHRGQFTDFPYYRLLVLMQDGVGDQTFYRVEYGYRAKITALTDRTWNRSTPEGLGVTFGLFKDSIAGRSSTSAENGPGFNAPLATSATAGTPGVFLPNGSSVPADLAGLQASSITADPTTAWTAGQHIELLDGSQAHWDGDSWEAGAAA